MKPVVIVLCGLLAGCVSRREVVVIPSIHVSVDAVESRRPSAENPVVKALANAAFGPDTAISQMALGCVRFYEQNARWPRTKEELAAGMKSAKLSLDKLAHVEDLKLREEGATLVIDCVSTENGRVRGTITLDPKNA